ncbi:MAG: FIST signal transduction protein [Terrimicrobiaceae bacterium]
MKLLQSILTPSLAWRDLTGELDPAAAELVLTFGLRQAIEPPEVLAALQARFPAARQVIVSTAGNFADTEIQDDGLVCTALQMESSTVRCVAGHFSPGDDLQALCKDLNERLLAPELRHVLVFSDGGLVNGTVLSEAFNAFLPPGVTLSGGLAGDGTDFAKTLVGLDEVPATGVIVAIGLYGGSLRIGFGSAGGWSCFGPVRTVTGSAGNVLHTLDDRPALEIYKTYLGPEAASLPGAALRFPLHVTSPGQPNPVVRTILSIDETSGSMTFAGDIPTGASARFMRASYEDLISGAEEAARQAGQSADLVLCVSCVGRRIVLGQRTEEELEGVRAAFGPTPVLTGFYSYGELAPSGRSLACQLHNQTMTITSLAEITALPT